MDEFHIDRVAGLVFRQIMAFGAGEASSGRGKSK